MDLYEYSKSVECDDCRPVWFQSNLCNSFTYKPTGLNFDTIVNKEENPFSS